jgi:hypothetical protein
MFILMNHEVFAQTSLQINADGKFDLLIIDPMGRKTGIDRTLGSTFSQIPNLQIGTATQGILDPSTGQSNIDSTTIDMVEGIIAPVISGDYKFILQGRTSSYVSVNIAIIFSDDRLRVWHGSASGFMDSSMTLTASLSIADNDTERTCIKQDLNQAYVVNEMKTMRKLGLIHEDAILDQYILHIDKFYTFLQAKSFAMARNALNTMIGSIRKDSASGSVSKSAVRDLILDISQLIQEIPQASSLGTIVLIESSKKIRLQSGVLEYYDGGWKEAANNNDGTFTIVTSQKSLSLRMTYENGTKTRNSVPMGTDTIVFQTVPAQVKLINSGGNPIDTGTVQYYSGAWRNFGTTSNGLVVKELLPNSYQFRMTYAFASKDKTQDIGTNPVVTFATVPASVELRNSQNTLIDQGTVQYYSGAWRNFGTTSNGIATKELLPNSYQFRMTYAFASKDKAQDIGTNPVVTFATVPASVELRNSQNALMDQGTVQYYSGAWRNFGVTSNGAVSKELLPNSYQFRMTYAFASKDKSQDLSTNPVVAFATVPASVELRNSQNTLMDQGTVQYYSGAWRDFGATSNGVVAKELLPNNYQFRMTYAFAGLDKTQDLNTNPTISFSTTLCTVRVKNAQHNPVDNATVSYYSGAWRAIGTTVGGEVTKELLPLNLQFRAKSGTVQQDKTQNISTNPIVEISLSIP